MNMNLRTAFQKSIETLVDFVTTQVDTNKTQVLFRTYAPVHFRFTNLNCSFDLIMLSIQILTSLILDILVLKTIITINALDG